MRFAFFLSVIGPWLHRHFSFGVLWSTILAIVFTVMGCTSVVVMAPLQVPQEKVRVVCWDPPEKGTGDEYFVFPGNSDEAVSESREAAFLAEVRNGGLIFKYVRGTPASSLNLIPLSRTDAWCTGIPKPPEWAQPLLQVCPEPIANEATSPSSKRFLGQADNPPVKSPLFCNQPGRLAPTTQELMVKRARELAYEDAYQWALKFATLTTQAKADLEYVTNQDASWLKQALTKDPGTIEQIQQRLADQLNSIEEPTEYTDPKLDMLARAGYQKGFEDGQFQVEATLFAIDAGVLILEVVAFEIAMGPLGGAKLVASAVSKGAKAVKVVAGAGAKIFQYTKSQAGRALEAAMVRLGEIPILIPGAVDGLGATIKLKTLLRALSNYHAKKLQSAMFAEARLLGKQLVKLATDETHHIVAHGSKKAEKARKLLEQFGIDIDHPANGVFLPGTKKAPNPKGSIVHKTLGNNKDYYKRVENYLSEATSQADAIQRLRNIGETLQNGTFWHAIK
jgi:A nuclease family of the HNH/ENDO VII superfamily with conserved AHH